MSEVALPSVYNAASMRSEYNRLRRHEAGISTARTLQEIEGFELQIQQRLKTIGEQEKVLSELIDGIVAKSVSAVLSSRANPTNLNGASGTVQKSAAQEDCYLHGIL